MDLVLKPMKVATGESGEGRLALLDGRLVAVLVRLSDLHGEQAGWWFIEKGFGPLDRPLHPTFPDLADAEAWLKAELADNRRLQG